jgi:C4-dicarboxylate transporter
MKMLITTAGRPTDDIVRREARATIDETNNVYRGMGRCIYMCISICLCIFTIFICGLKYDHHYDRLVRGTATCMGTGRQ